MVPLETPERRVWTIERPGKISLIQGYAAIYYERFGRPGECLQRVLPGAFDQTLQDPKEVVACIDYNTDPTMQLASTKCGTLLLQPVELGLKATIYPPDRKQAHEIISLINRDKADMSFAWVTMDGSWSADENGEDVRDLIRVELCIVSVMSHPLPDRLDAARPGVA